MITVTSSSSVSPMCPPSSRTFSRGLSAEPGIELESIAAAGPGVAVRRPPPGIPNEIVSVPLQERWDARLDLLRRPLGYLSRGEFGARVRRLATEAEILRLDQVQTAWCDLATDVPALVHLHYLVRLDRPGRPPGLRAAAQLFGLSRGERAAVRRHRFLVANSPVVAAELRARAPQADVTVVPLVLDPAHYAPGAPIPQVAGFIGQGTWPTTAASARRLVERVWPRVRRKMPEARLLMAGRGVRELGLPATAGVEILGEVDSAARFLRDVSLLLFPTEHGTGMKVKVLEALACGVPTVTTPIGAEGIAPTDGVAVATEDVELAHAALAILRDEAERKAEERRRPQHIRVATHAAGGGAHFRRALRPNGGFLMRNEIRLLAYTDAETFGGAEQCLATILAGLPPAFSVTVAATDAEVVESVAATRAERRRRTRRRYHDVLESVGGQDAPTPLPTSRAAPLSAQPQDAVFMLARDCRNASLTPDQARSGRAPAAWLPISGRPRAQADRRAQTGRACRGLGAHGQKCRGFGAASCPLDPGRAQRRTWSRVTVASTSAFRVRSSALLAGSTSRRDSTSSSTP